MGGKACKPKTPAGWTLVRSLETAFSLADAPPVCPDGAAPTTYFKDPAPSQCGNCFCQWFGATCTEPQVSCYYTTDNCTGPAAFSYTPPGSGCTGPGPIPKNPGSVASCKITANPTVASPGACSANLPQQVNKNPWLKQVRVCAAQVDASSACVSGQCVIDGSGSYVGPACVRAQGDLACPAAWPNKTVVYTSETDTRTCSQCTCGQPQTTCNSGVYNAFDDLMCAGAAQSFSGCANIGNRFSGDNRSLKPPQVSAATTINGCFGGLADGEVTPVGPYTICCE
ncbi:MAG: hypothetical protein R3B70_30480 [Polyangiaceae bacterium]